MVHSVLKIAKISSCCTRTNTRAKSEATTEGYRVTRGRQVFGHKTQPYRGREASNSAAGGACGRSGRTASTRPEAPGRRNGTARALRRGAALRKSDATRIGERQARGARMDKARTVKFGQNDDVLDSRFRFRSMFAMLSDINTLSMKSMMLVISYNKHSASAAKSRDLRATDLHRMRIARSPARPSSL